MRRIRFIISGLLIVFVSFGQGIDRMEKLKQVGDGLSLNFQELGKIALNSTLKLSDLYKIDSDFKVLESLGKPVDIIYKDHIGYEIWRYQYTDMYLDLINQNGYITLQSVTLIPNLQSNFSIANKTLVPNTKLKQIASFKSSMLNDNRDEIQVQILSQDQPKVKGVKFRITLNEGQKTIRKIRIDFDDL